MPNLAFSVVFLVSLAAACSSRGGAATDGSVADGLANGFGAPALGGPPCAPGTPTPVVPTDVTPGGYAPAELLAKVQGQHAAQLTWGSNVSEVSVSPSGTTELLVDVTPIDGGIRYSQPETEDGSASVLCGPGFLTIDARVRFVTTDRGFDEDWQGTLLAYDRSSATFTKGLDQAPLSGSFRATYTGSENWDSTSTSLSATFDSRGVSGDVNYITSKSFATGPNSGGGFGLNATVAKWVPDSTFDAGIGDASPATATDAAITD